MDAVQFPDSYAPSPAINYSFVTFTTRFTEDGLENALIASEEGERPKQRAAARHWLIDAALYINEPEIWTALVEHLTEMSYDMTVSVLDHFAELCPFAHKIWADQLTDWVLTREFRLNPPAFMHHTHCFPTEPDDLEPIPITTR